MYKNTITAIKANFLQWVIVGSFLFLFISGAAQSGKHATKFALSGKPINHARVRININEGWRFMRYENETDQLKYDERPLVSDKKDNVIADTRATDSSKANSNNEVLKNWILPSANDFIKDPSKQHKRPGGNPGSDFPFVQANFNDGQWEPVDLPHDWAIRKDFLDGPNAIIGGGMGRLPTHGVAWYRRKLDIPMSDKDKTIILEIDGAMSYAMVWLNGKLVGGWPYGYNSFQLDLTPYIIPGGDNQLAIRIDNPTNSSRWYTGGGIYRNVWLSKMNKIHIAQWGTTIKTKDVSSAAATVDLEIFIQNNSAANKKISSRTEMFLLGTDNKTRITPVATIRTSEVAVSPNQKINVKGSASISKPQLWGPPPSQKPRLYLAVTSLFENGKLIDEYETRFGIRSISFDPIKGIIVNGEPIKIKGVNQHHDLGALGAAFNTRAAERQLDLLKELGCNAIRMAHNPPAPELLDLTDQYGFLVIDEIFDCWEKGKNPLDFHLIFSDWYEADTRSFIRRDKNHPSVIAWSYGNEVGEQYTAEEGASLARKIYSVVKDEDETRPATVSMNYAKPDMPLPKEVDILCLNYQGEGIRDAPAYAHLKGIRTPPLYPAFQKAFPQKLIVSAETSSALSTRGSFIFPLISGNSAPVSDSTGGDPIKKQVSAYEFYTSQFGASPDKVFATQDKHPYVAGEFVWTGWDYLGEPTPYYSARSSYSGIIDLAGFKKDRFYLYQSRWRPEIPVAHILPHWNWPERTGEITPVHVFTSGDEVELFLNGQSMGRKKKQDFEYRLRWDDIKYQPGTLKVVAYKNGKVWVVDSVKTTGSPAKLRLSADRNAIIADGKDLSFITVAVMDAQGRVVPNAENNLHFTIEGPGEICATDNGDPASLVSFASKERKAFYGWALAIVKAKKKQGGFIRIKVHSEGLESGSITIQAY